jgi:histidine triad (HIT) family protein
VHVLVIPRRPIDRLSNAALPDQAILGKCLLTAAEVARKLGVSDYRLVVNNGPGAGQSVFHLHIHLLAGRPLGWPPG